MSLWLNFIAVLDPTTNLTTATHTGEGPYHEFEGSQGHVVVFVGFGKHHHFSEPDLDSGADGDWGCCTACNGELGTGQRVTPSVFGSQIGSFCEGTWEPAEICPQEVCDPTSECGGLPAVSSEGPQCSCDYCCRRREHGWHCTAVGFDPILSTKTKNGLLNNLGGAPWGYPGESIYSPYEFSGGIVADVDDRDHRVDVLRDLAFHGSPNDENPKSDDGTRIDLGGEGCTPMAAGFYSDFDHDGIPNQCDPCPSGSRPDVAIWQGGEFVGVQDLDQDGVSDGCDVCPGHADPINTNLDGEDVNGQDHVPDGCDPYATARIGNAVAPAPFEQASFAGSTACTCTRGATSNTAAGTPSARPRGARSSRRATRRHGRSPRSASTPGATRRDSRGLRSTWPWRPRREAAPPAHLGRGARRARRLCARAVHRRSGQRHRWRRRGDRRRGRGRRRIRRGDAHRRRVRSHRPVGRLAAGGCGAARARGAAAAVPAAGLRAGLPARDDAVQRLEHAPVGDPVRRPLDDDRHRRDARGDRRPRHGRGVHAASAHPRAWGGTVHCRAVR
ncbi:MAG: thrombospondin type 3 repeat-containing protein [Myxococcales bacterium]|nr:thrombospondin type 3 repeat-containing protein [Myxococcales bacterium]